MAGLDEGYSIELARNCIGRFMFRISTYWRKLDNLYKGDQGLFGDPESLASGRFAQNLIEILKCGFVRKDILDQLDIAGRNASEVVSFANASDLINSLKQRDELSRKEAIRAAILNDLCARTLSDSVLTSLETRYRLLADFFEDHHNEMIEKLRGRWLDDLFSDPLRDPFFSRTAGIKFSSDRERWGWDLQQVESICLSIWFLFVFFCRQLQTNDFEMTATEAYWLGLIDEVIGLDLESPRRLVENAPDDIPAEHQGGVQP